MAADNLNQEDVTCTNCGHNFPPDTLQRELIEKMKKNGANLAMLKCPKCWFSFGLDINVPSSISEEIEETWRCPVYQCDGWVSLIDNDDDAEWACGECGSIWQHKENLISEVESAVARFPYRAPFYERDGNEIRPSSVVTVPDYYEKVKAEPPDNNPDYVRG